MSVLKKIPPQITRLTLLAVILVGLFLIARHFLVPSSFGKYGHYRADSIAEIEALPVNYAGHGDCGACHPGIVKIKDSSSHKNVACESCHGPAKAHTEDPMSVKPMRPKGRDFCGLCHSKNAARPKTMPQIDLDKHNTGVECTACHNSHAPRLK